MSEEVEVVEFGRVSEETQGLQSGVLTDKGIHPADKRPDFQ